jgi:hypothetical protein
MKVFQSTLNPEQEGMLQNYLARLKQSVLSIQPEQMVPNKVGVTKALAKRLWRGPGGRRFREKEVKECGLTRLDRMCLPSG